MYLSKIHIVNFKSLKDVSFEFHPKVNILTGVNNAGKTTVLEAIALWHECYRKLIREAQRSVKGQYKDGDYILGTTAPTYVSYHDITSVRSPNYNDVFYNLIADPKKPIKLKATLKSDKGEELDIALLLSRADGDNYRISCDNFRNFNFKLFNNEQFLIDPKTGIQLTYASPVASILPVEERQLPSKIKYLKQSRASLQVFRNRLAMLYNRRNSDFDQFKEQLKLILTNDTLDISFAFVNDTDNINEIVKIKIGRESLKDISLLGSGTLQIIEILLSLFEDRKDLNIILLDEPDSHIHHALQKRLIETLEKFTDNSQVFLTTHNTALLQTAKLEWVFHLEQQSEYTYRPIVNQPINGLKKGFQPTNVSPIIRNLTGTNALDFIYALEADKLILVEGEDDAIRIQKILSFRINDRQRYAFWAAGGVNAYFFQIGALKSIFSTIKNKQTLWEKSVLIMDKDDMTETHKLNIIDGFTNKLNIKTYIWDSYNFESILLSDLDKLANLLSKYINLKQVASSTSVSLIKVRLETALSNLLLDLKTLYETDSELNNIFGKLKARREVFTNSHFGLNLKGVFEEDKDLKMKMDAYYKACLTLKNAHKICRKPHFTQIINDVLLLEGLSFDLEQNFDELFFLIDRTTLFDDFNFILNI